MIFGKRSSRKSEGWDKWLTLFLSFLMSFFLFLMVLQKPEQEIMTQALIQVELPPEYLMVGQRDLLTRVQVRSKGDLDLIHEDKDQLLGQIIFKEIDSPGLVYVSLSRDLFPNLSNEIDLIFLQNSLVFSVDYKKSALKKVQIQFSSEGVNQDAFSLHPSEILVEGPASDLDQLNSISTIPLDVDWFEKTGVLRVSLDMTQLDLFTLSQNWVDIHYRMWNQ